MAVIRIVTFLVFVMMIIIIILDTLARYIPEGFGKKKNEKN